MRFLVQIANSPDLPKPHHQCEVASRRLDVGRSARNEDLCGSRGRRRGRGRRLNRPLSSEQIQYTLLVYELFDEGDGLLEDFFAAHDGRILHERKRDAVARTRIDFEYLANFTHL